MSEIKQISLNGTVYDLRDAEWIGTKTNCITAISQDINLTVASGTLTLHAGSKLYYPDGFEADGTTRKFTEVITPSDYTRSDTGAISKKPCFYIVDETRILPYANAFSGATAPTFSGQGIWYDTTNNLIKRSVDSGSTWQAVKVSFPLGLVSNDGTGYKTVDDVFNGAGYIGSTFYALKGVSCLVPNGRNADGTLKSTAYTRTVIQIITLGSNNNDKGIEAAINSAALVYNKQYYDPITNYIYTNADFSSSPYNATTIATFDATNGVISNFKIRRAYRALDSNDTGYIAHQAMPSLNYISYSTSTATDTSFIAPADGYVYTQGQVDTAYGYCILALLNNSGNVVMSTESQTPTSTGVRLFLPVSKGDTFKIQHANFTINTFRFVYAQGAQ